ncbi:MAG: Gfo/Idh/MocA family oxidoreductase [Thermoguttaceae bacterium]
MSTQSTRRSFLRTSTAAVAALAITNTKTALGSSANEKIKVAVIGQGGRGRMLTKMFKEHGGYEVAAVADYFPKTAKEGAALVGVPEQKAFSGLAGYKRVLDSGVDAMVLQTPPYFFPAHSQAAVKAGCHVYVAKPIAVDVPGSLSIDELGKKSTANKKVFHVDFQLRYLPYFVECVKHMREGKMGDIRFVRAFYNDEGREDVAIKNNVSDLFQKLRWAMSRELGGDRILSGGIHAIDTALVAIGSRPERACGVLQRSRKNPINSAMDTASLTYSFPGGLIMNYSGDQFRNYHHEIDKAIGVKAYADHAYMETFYGKGMTCMRKDEWRYKGGENPELYVWGALHNVDLFHKCITEGNHKNATVPGAVEANLACLLGAYAGRAQSEMTWKQLLANDEKIEIDMKSLQQ